MTYLGAIGRGLLRQKMAEYRQEQEASGRHRKRKLVLKFEMANSKAILENTSLRLENLRKRETDQSDDILFQDAESQDPSYEKCDYKFANAEIKDKHHEMKKQLDVSNRRFDENNLSRNTKSISGQPMYDNKQIHRPESAIDNKMGQSEEDILQNVDNHKDKNGNVNNEGLARADLEENCRDLTEKLDAFQIDDDGIKFNIKLRNLLDYFKERSGSPAKFDELFRLIYKSCLGTRKLIPKFVKVVTSRSIQKMEIQGRRFLPEFLKLLQKDFEHCEELQRKQPETFHNIVVLMGEFLAVMKVFEPIKASLLVLLEMLLNTAEIDDTNLFLEQIFVNRYNLGLEAASPLIIQVRKTLIKKKDLPSQSRARLMMALDLVLNPASLKSKDLVNLYQEQLEVE